MLYCGDCMLEMRKIEANSIDLILCDLPYEVTACEWDVVLPLTQLWRAYKRLMKPTTPIVLTACQPFTSMLVMSNREWFRYEWVWNKVQPTGYLNAKRQPMRVCESVVVFYCEQPTYNPQMGVGEARRRTMARETDGVYGRPQRAVNHSDETRQPTTLLTFSSGRAPSVPQLHPTQKPVALMEYLIRTYTKPGDTVLDNCMGSGTTGVACVKTDRRFIGIEQDSRYFAVAEKRIAAAGEQSTLLRRRSMTGAMIPESASVVLAVELSVAVTETPNSSSTQDSQTSTSM